MLLCQSGKEPEQYSHQISSMNFKSCTIHHENNGFNLEELSVKWNKEKIRNFAKMSGTCWIWTIYPIDLFVICNGWPLSGIQRVKLLLSLNRFFRSNMIHYSRKFCKTIFYIHIFCIANLLHLFPNGCSVVLLIFGKVRIFVKSQNY